MAQKQQSYEYTYTYQTSEVQNQQSQSKQQGQSSYETNAASKGASKKQSSYEYANEQLQNSAKSIAQQSKRKTGSFFQCCGGIDPQAEKKLTVEMSSKNRDKKDKAANNSNNQQATSSNQQNRNKNQQVSSSLPRAQSNYIQSRGGPVSTFQPQQRVYSPVPIHHAPVQHAPVMPTRFFGNQMSRSFILRNVPTPPPIHRPIINTIQHPIVNTIQRPIINTVPLQQSKVVAQSVPHCCHHITFCHELHNQPHHQNYTKSHVYVNGNNIIQTPRKERVISLGKQYHEKDPVKNSINEWDEIKNKYEYGLRKDEIDLKSYYKRDQNPQQTTPKKPII